MNREIPLPESGDVVVGRDAGCEITIDDARASRRHATFHVTPGMVTVEDNASRNGVRVNDVAINGVRTVAHGDRVEVGTHVFILMDSERSRSPLTKSTPHAMTRRVDVAVIPRAAETPLEAVARSLQVGDVAAAARAMDSLVPRFARSDVDPNDPELARAVALMIQLSRQPRCGRFLDRVFQIHAVRKLVPSGESIEAIKLALPGIGPMSSAAIESYLQAMAPGTAALPVVDQVRLRRLESLVRASKTGEAR